jgi:hypothetical protein
VAEVYINFGDTDASAPLIPQEMTMKIKISVIKVLCFFFMLFLSSEVYSACFWDGNTGTVASPYNHTDFADCVKDAAKKKGAVVIAIPAASVTWDTAVSVNMSNSWTSVTNLTIQGSGVDRTILKPAYSGKNHLIAITGKNGKGFRVTGFTVDANSANAGHGFIQISGDCQAFRVDSMKFLNTTGVGLKISGKTYGVIDNVTFIGQPGTTGKHPLQIIHRGGENADEWQSWADPTTFGSAKAVFVENCTFSFPVNSGGTNDMCIDAYGGARYVLRYNLFTNCYPGHHGLDTGWYRSPVIFEIYSNTHNSSVGHAVTANRAMTIRGGTGLIYNNSYDNSFATAIYTLQNFRSCYPNLSSNWRICNNTNLKLCSNLGLDAKLAVAGNRRTTAEHTCTSDSDCNICSVSLQILCTTNHDCPTGETCGTSNYRCNRMFCSITKDKLCSVNGDCPGGETCSAFFDGNSDGTGYPCRDQVGRGPNQSLLPLHQWNNGAPVFGVYTNANCHDPAMTDHIKAGRDYFDNRLYSYKPYIYPHPLRGLINR